ALINLFVAQEDRWLIEETSITSARPIALDTQTRMERARELMLSGWSTEDELKLVFELQIRAFLGEGIALPEAAFMHTLFEAVYYADEQNQADSKRALVLLGLLHRNSSLPGDDNARHLVERLREQYRANSSENATVARRLTADEQGGLGRAA